MLKIINKKAHKLKENNFIKQKKNSRKCKCKCK